MTGGKSPGWGQREVCLPWPPGCWRQISEKGSAALGQRFLWSRQSGHQDRHGKSEGGCSKPGGGEVSLPGQKAWLGRPWPAQSVLSFMGQVGDRGTSKNAHGTVSLLSGSLQSSLCPQSEIHQGLVIRSLPLQMLPVLHLLRQFPLRNTLLPPSCRHWGEACRPFPLGNTEPLAWVLWGTPFLPEGRSEPSSLGEPAQLQMPLKWAASCAFLSC